MKRLTSSKTFRQYAKFCVIGGICFIVDATLHYLLMFKLQSGHELLSTVVGRAISNMLGGHLDPSKCAFPFFKAFTTMIGIVIGYLLNSLWTFRVGLGSGNQAFLRYTVVALSGFALNLILSATLYNIVPGHPKQSWAVAMVVSTGLVSIFNFLLQRHWTFARPAVAMQ